MRYRACVLSYWGPVSLHAFTIFNYATKRKERPGVFIFALNPLYIFALNIIIMGLAVES